MMLIIDKNLIFFAFLTAAIELPLFYWCGYRSWQLLAYFLGANIVSNLLLNEGLPAYSPVPEYWLILATGEILVLLVEFYLLDYIVVGSRRHLFRTLCFTNAVSLLIGLLIFFY